MCAVVCGSRDGREKERPLNLQQGTEGIAACCQFVPPTGVLYSAFSMISCIHYNQNLDYFINIINMTEKKS